MKRLDREKVYDLCDRLKRAGSHLTYGGVAEFFGFSAATHSRAVGRIMATAPKGVPTDVIIKKETK